MRQIEYSIMSFRHLNLSNSLLNALDDLGYQQPTTIQEKAFPVVMSGKDMVGIAQTGTGKTFAYLLPCLRLWQFTKSKHPQILIIVPTRELVVQVVEQVEKLTKYMNVVVTGVYGGTNMKTQMTAIENGLDVVVGTPGRLLDLILAGSLRTRDIKRFVIDEVDEMLNLGFRPQIIRVMDLLPPKRQNLMFSATMTEEVEAIIDDFFNYPQIIEAAPMGTPLDNIQQTAYHVPNFYTKVNLLSHLLSKTAEFTKVLIFVATKKLADDLYEQIDKQFPEQISVIHSNKSQNYRFESVNQFKSGQHRILIATDIVARGIDISEVSHVINFDTPDVPENYIHRIGRTGRADKKGNSITFITDNEREYQEAIEELMKTPIPIEEIPDEVIISDELTEDELPKVNMKVIQVKLSKIDLNNSAFHEKLAKNKKFNVRQTRAQKMAAKYKKPQTRGAKKK